MRVMLVAAGFGVLTVGGTRPPALARAVRLTGFPGIRLAPAFRALLVSRGQARDPDHDAHRHH